MNLIAEDGVYQLGKEPLDDYDLKLVPDHDMMYFTSGEYSTIQMMFIRNRFGNRRLLYGGGTIGRNLRKLLKLHMILVPDKR